MLSQCLVLLLRLYSLLQWLPLLHLFIGNGHAMTNAQLKDLKYTLTGS